MSAPRFLKRDLSLVTSAPTRICNSQARRGCGGESAGFALAIILGRTDITQQMKACLDAETLVESATPQLREIAVVGASFMDPNTKDAHRQFSYQVAMLEGTLKQTFRAATLLAKRSDDLKQVAEVWKRTGRFCDTVVATLLSLKDRYSNCGTPELYALALDYKQACEDRLCDVEEEIECQEIDLPKGLLPEPN